MSFEIRLANRYRLDKEIGSGGFGVVYEGTNIESKKKVAIKIVTKLHSKKNPLHFQNIFYKKSFIIIYLTQQKILGIGGERCKEATKTREGV